MSEEYIKEDNHFKRIGQFKNRWIKGKSRSPQTQLGNSTSLAGSRPSGYIKCNTRVIEKKINHDTELHQTIDHHQTKTPYLYRKSSIQTIVPYRTILKCNQQIVPKISNYSKTAQQPKIIHLKQIADNLYLGNSSVVNDPNILRNHYIHVIINLDDHVLKTHYRSSCQIYNVYYKDTRYLSCHEFLDIIAQTIRIIENNSGKQILLVCRKGVNRSVSMAIAYAIIKKEQSYDEIVQYIEAEKNQKYSNWDCLTNYRIRDLLRKVTATAIM